VERDPAGLHDEQRPANVALEEEGLALGVGPGVEGLEQVPEVLAGEALAEAERAQEVPAPGELIVDEEGLEPAQERRRRG